METRTKTAPPEASIGQSAEGEIADPPSDDIPPPPSEPDRTGDQISHFVLHKKLGQGGMGVVYAAEDTLLHRKVALKILPAAVTQNPERRRRFLREARAASAIAHPTIATIYEVGEHGDDVFLAMELAPGKTLRDILEERRAPLEIPEAIRIASEITQGVAKAHETGIIHRDLKLENIMLGSEGGAPTSARTPTSTPIPILKILDFGLAKQSGLPAGGAIDPTAATASVDFATIEGRILGTPGYMSPEQSKGKPVDARTDIFALGVILYELLTGERPFRGTTAVEVLIAVDRDPHAPPSAKNPRVPPELDRIVARCLEKRPDDRFPSCRDLLDALASVPLDGSIPAPTAPRAETAAPSAPASERRPSPLRIGIPLGAAGILAAVAILWFAQRPPAPNPTATNSESAPLASADPSIPTASGSALPASPLASPPPRRPCLDGEPGKTTCRDADVIPWCDLRGAAIACCGKGLVPVGADGICGCAPGGTSVPTVIAGGCHEPPNDAKEAYALVRTKAVEAAIACFQPFYEAGKTKSGMFAATFALTPEGEVIGARVDETTMPHQGAQACALAVLRSTRFPPPKAEDVGQPLGFGFVFDDQAPSDKKKQ